MLQIFVRLMELVWSRVVKYRYSKIICKKYRVCGIRQAIFCDMNSKSERVLSVLDAPRRNSVIIKVKYTTGTLKKG